MPSWLSWRPGSRIAPLRALAVRTVLRRARAEMINVFVPRWLRRLRLPFGPEGHDAGYYRGNLDAAGGDLLHHRL
jgi:hypothetical protein